MSEAILRLPLVLKATGLSRSSIYQMMEDGAFPRSVKIGKRSVGWLASEVEAWLNQKSAERRAAMNFCTN